MSAARRMEPAHLGVGVALVLCLVACLRGDLARGDDGYELWLKYAVVRDEEQLKNYRELISSLLIQGQTGSARIIRSELQRGLRGLLGRDVPLVESPRENGTLLVGTPRESPLVRKLTSDAAIESLGNEGFSISSVRLGGRRLIVIAAKEEVGLMYGAFHLLRAIQTHESLAGVNVSSRPRIRYRLLDHWDNLDGTVERGYAGKSLWKWSELPARVDPRYQDYARANASIGINGAVLNNVNANPDILKEEYLKKVARLADEFRPYGIHVFLSINFASPVSGEFSSKGNRKGGIGRLDTADPLDPRVRLWWKDKAQQIYRLIPDFGGFLVKADSEGMPGPQEYGRTHAEGANMLAEAVAPYHGIVMWRAFIYNPEVDPDRAKRAYKEFVPLDGRFSSNVFVQAKSGPVDFQPREPVQPLFGAMPRTPLMLELQITQEYLGHATHLVYLAPMWKEYLQFDTYAAGRGSTLASVVDGTLHGYRMTGIAGVANIGDDRNWCGHLFGQANWYAFGRLAWDHTLTAGQIAGEWIRMTLGHDDRVLNSVRHMMMGSWEACVSYMTPLGLHHIMQPGFHYGPAPDNNKGRLDWTSVYYHRADSSGLGYDRSSRGTDAVGQYSAPLRDMFDDISSCPEKYLLWFHHVPWDRRMRSGRSLWEELCHKYYEGTRYVDEMVDQWMSLEDFLDPQLFSNVQERLSRQQEDAANWRDTCLAYFQKFSGKPITDPGKK